MIYGAVVTKNVWKDENDELEGIWKEPVMTYPSIWLGD
jgi:hypothetical protein